MGRGGGAQPPVVVQEQYCWVDNTKKLQDRFNADYAASTEVATVLKQSTAVDTFMQGSASSMKGRNEWDRQVVYLKQLASAYATTFPLPDGAAVRRMNDKETAGAVVAKPDKDAAKKDLDLLIKLADTVKSRTSGGKPATADLRQLLDQTAKVEAFVGAHPITPMTNWQDVRTSLAILQQAFGVTP